MMNHHPQTQTVFMPGASPSKPSRGHGFTLIELLLTISILAIVGLGIYSLFDSGIRVVDRVSQSMREEDLTIFFEKLSRDLQNTFVYELIPFAGDEETMTFATTVMTKEELGSDLGIGEVTYSLSGGKEAVMRGQRHLSEVFKEDKAAAVPVLEGVKEMRLAYFQFDPNDESYGWVGEWEDPDNHSPLAVKMTLEYYDGTGRYEITRTIWVATGFAG
jgi:prepilin-type N-terminal cleavage/methylation domain-containing protein